MRLIVFHECYEKKVGRSLRMISTLLLWVLSNMLISHKIEKKI